MENDKTKNKSNDIPTMGVSQCSLPSLRGRGRGRGWFGDTLPSSFISYSLSLPLKSVSAVLTLLDEGCTIPFISRYRKERTGNLDEVQITNISELNDRLKELGKRKETILKTIREQEKLTAELEAKIWSCMDSTELEDIYLPYKPKRRTRAQIAREQGLEPLALAIMEEAQNPTAPPNLPEGGVGGGFGFGFGHHRRDCFREPASTQYCPHSLSAWGYHHVEGHQEDEGYR